MKIILVGATGTIGKTLLKNLSQRHDVVPVSFSKSDIKVDITSLASIEAMYKTVGPFDALVSAVGSAYFGSFESMTEEDLYKGIRSKMMGQINLVLAGKKSIRDNGSFTLTSGILAEDPIRNGAALTMVNGAVNGFVLGASVELSRGVRINAVSPGLVEDSAGALGAAFPGHVAVPMDRVVTGYLKSIEGVATGKVISIYG